MTKMLDDKARRFRDLHDRDGIFIMPNAWDAGSAAILAGVGFEAIGTTSAGVNFKNATTDYDYHVPRDDMLAEYGAIAKAVDVPVNGDLENGYGDRPEDVAETIRQSIRHGMVGGGIEDHTGDPVPEDALGPLGLVRRTWKKKEPFVGHQGRGLWSLKCQYQCQ